MAPNDTVSYILFDEVQNLPESISIRLILYLLFNKVYKNIEKIGELNNAH